METMDTMEEIAPAASYARLKGDPPANSRTGSGLHAAVVQDHVHSEWPTFILVMGGSATGAAFLGGGLLGSPLGAIGGTVVGIALALLLYKRSHKH